MKKWNGLWFWCLGFFSLTLGTLFASQSQTAPAKDAATSAWWENGVIYQIYPRSFADSDGNGIGDLRGISSRVEHLRKLGVSAVWLSPVYPSPEHDFGYDVADYKAINPLFGSMADFEALVRSFHAQGIKVVLDMVFNHTSSVHPWFQSALADPKSPYRDYYVWKQGKGSHGQKRPNNWLNFLGESAWTKDQKNNAWYLHQFLSGQPDLNYRNPKVETEMLAVLDFWMDKGVDGFRFDVIHTLYEAEHFNNHPFSWRLIPSAEDLSSFFQKIIYTVHQPETVQFVQRMRSHVEQRSRSVLLLGETIGAPEVVRRYYGTDRPGLHLGFNFTFLPTTPTFGVSVSAEAFYRTIGRIDASLPAPLFPCYVYSNHDLPRLPSRIGAEADQKIRLLALLQMALRGTAVMYYGEEIGLPNTRLSREEMKDPAGKKFWFLPVKRDAARTPMQWDATRHAGFSRGDTKPWLPVQPDYPLRNVAVQSKDPTSMLVFYRRAIELRKHSAILKHGDMQLLKPLRKELFAMQRRGVTGERLVYLGNFSARPLTLPGAGLKDMLSATSGELTISTHSDRSAETVHVENGVVLAPFEGMLLLLPAAVSDQ